MTIREYIYQFKDRERARRELAEKVGVSVSAVKSWTSGQRHPSRQKWAKIVAATNKKITIVDLAS